MKHRVQLQNVAFRPRVAISGLLAIIICTLLCFSTSYIAAQVVAADPLKATTSPQSPTDQPVVSSTASTTSQTCVPLGDTQAPAPVDLSDTADGLKQVVDPPKLYQIFGDTSDALRTQIRQCAPKSGGQAAAEFTAQTNYQLTWRYDYAEIGNGRCQVTNASVGLHINQVIPQWTAPSAASPKLASQWNDFMQALTAHEQGHVSLDLQYAQMLLGDIKNFPPTSCGQMPESIRHLTDTDANQLIQANDNYDETTNHGATQGAILP